MRNPEFVIGDRVEVPEPKGNDEWSYGFVGHITKLFIKDEVKMAAVKDASNFIHNIPIEVLYNFSTDIPIQSSIDEQKNY